MGIKSFFSSLTEDRTINLNGGLTGRIIELEQIGGDKYRVVSVDDDDDNSGVNDRNQKSRHRMLRIWAGILVAALSITIYLYVQPVLGVHILPAQKMQKQLDEMNSAVITTNAVLFVTSQTVAAVFGERSDPLTEKIDDLNDYLLIANLVILIEKVLLSCSEVLFLVLFLPSAAVLFSFAKNQLAKRLLLTGLVLYFLIPVSLGLTYVVADNLGYSEDYKNALTSESAASGMVTESDSGTGNDGFWGWLSDIGDKLKNSVNTIVNSLNVETIKTAINQATNKVLVFLAVDIVIPIMTIAVGALLIKWIWNVDILLNSIARKLR